MDSSDATTGLSTRTRLSATTGLAMAALLGVLAVGCGDNLTLVERQPYDPADPEPLACMPNLDGRIDAAEVRPAIGVSVHYLVSPAGETRPVDVAGGIDEDGQPVWDWSLDQASDQQAVVVPSSIAGKWYEGSFPLDTFVTPFDAGGTVESVLRQDDQALWLLGVASREAAPPEGQTLLIYQQPVAVLRFPLTPGASHVSTGAIENGVLRGLPYAGSDTYEVEVDAVGTLGLPQLVFEQVHRVRQHVTVSPAVGVATSRRQVSYFFECFAEVARAVSLPDEANEDFTTAAEVWRLGLQ